jgi:hypothetical protein
MNRVSDERLGFLDYYSSNPEVSSMAAELLILRAAFADYKQLVEQIGVFGGLVGFNSSVYDAARKSIEKTEAAMKGEDPNA